MKQKLWLCFYSFLFFHFYILIASHFSLALGIIKKQKMHEGRGIQNLKNPLKQKKTSFLNLNLSYIIKIFVEYLQILKKCTYINKT